MKSLKAFLKKRWAILLSLSVLLVVFKANIGLFLTSGIGLHAEEQEEDRKESFFDIKKLGGGALTAAALAGLAYKMYTHAQNPKLTTTDKPLESADEIPPVELPADQEMVPNLFVYHSTDTHDKLAVPLLFYQHSKTLQNMLKDLDETESFLQQKVAPIEIPFQIELHDMREIFYLLVLNELSSSHYDLEIRIAQFPFGQLVRLINDVNHLEIESLISPLLNACMEKIMKMDMKQIMESEEIATLSFDLYKKRFITFVTTNLENAIIQQYAQNREKVCLVSNLPSSQKGWHVPNANRNPIKFSPDGTKVVCAGKNKLFIHDFISGQTQAKSTNDTADRIRHIAFSPDGKQLVSGDYNGKVLLWKQENEKPSQLLHHDDHVSCIEFSPDGKKLAIGYNKGTLFLLNLEDANSQPLELSNHSASGKYATNAITAVTFSSDSKKMISVARGLYEKDCETLLLWQLDPLVLSPKSLVSTGLGWRHLYKSANEKIIILWGNNSCLVGFDLWDNPRFENIELTEEEEIKGVSLINNDTQIVLVRWYPGGYFALPKIVLERYSMVNMELDAQFSLLGNVNDVLFYIDSTRFITDWPGEFKVDQTYVQVWNMQNSSCKNLYTLIDDDELISLAYSDTKICMVSKNHSGRSLYLLTLITEQEKTYVQRIVNGCNKDQLRYLFAAFLEFSRGKQSNVIMGISVDICNSLPEELQNFLIAGRLEIP